MMSNLIKATEEGPMSINPGMPSAANARANRQSRPLSAVETKGGRDARTGGNLMIDTA